MKQEKVIRINNIKLKPDHTEAELLKAVKKALRLKNNCDIKSDIIKRSIDARHKPDIMYVYSVDVKKLVINNKDTDLKAFAKKTANNNITYNEKVIYEFPYGRINNYEGAGIKEEDRPVIIGFGPAGMFAALKLSEAGLMPVVYERGDSIEERHRKVDEFWNTGKLDTQSNVQFGEGGAGTFSDGKLNTVIKDPTGRIRNVLEMFVRFGASSEILYSNKPHIGTDVLIDLVSQMRQEIISLGGEFCFHTQVTDVNLTSKTLKIVHLSENSAEEVSAGAAVFAIGHSARDTFEMLYKHQIPMRAKSFAVGVRIEHPQTLIDHSQYGRDRGYDLPAAAYKLTENLDNGRGVYTFCMCPGGYVVNASSEEHRLAVNGMSYHDRAGENANSAVVVTVTPDDFGSDHPLAGIAFQRKLEKAAYKAGKGKIPVQRYGDFYRSVTGKEKEKTEAEVWYQGHEPCMKGAYEETDLAGIFPAKISSALVDGMEDFNKKIRGFSHPLSVLSGVESRTSSPVRIVRDNHSLESVIGGLYPCGEGAGYAGGITSAAADGIKIAEKIRQKYAPFL